MKTARIKDSYNPQEKESYWQEFWEDKKINRFDQESSKKLFTIDTPPPTISGALHLGHVFSYSQAEVIARYRRLAGFNVRYPMGFDNNGLPTERLVEKEKGIQGRSVPLAEFVKICLEVTDIYKEKYKSLWKSLGLSIDWELEYSTISPEAQRLAQRTFRELFEKGAIYRKEATALYCYTCHTSVAQAEVEDKEMDSVFYDLIFKRSNGSDLIISTTRPELLPACVAVFVHPDDKRYSNIVGKTITTPLGKSIRILTDDKVLIDKGTGAVMCCTFGDETDVYWVRTHKLPERIILTAEGKFVHLDEFPEAEGKSISETRKLIVGKLRELGAIRKEEPLKHEVGVHERCGTPIELIPTVQWFVKFLKMKDKLLKAGNDIRWYPAYMKKRYEDWVTGLKWDWGISRERFFGVPIPAYVCDSCGHIHIPDESIFPVDPKIESKIPACPKCSQGKMVPEKGVLDTWFTSALTPDLNNEFTKNGKLIGKMYPMSMRPQGHDIIRTWVTYSILMGLYRHNDIPWNELMISGHILMKKGEKISKKTGGGKYKPEELINTNSADAVRYAMYGATLGRDGYYEEQEVKKGRKLMIKLYNAGKLIISSLEDFFPDSVKDESKLEVIDRWIIMKFREAAKQIAKEFERYEYSRARHLFEEFFWKDFCDNYLEIIKGRIRDIDESAQKKRLSAQYALYYTYLNCLKVISPLLPHIAEEMFHAEVSPQGTYSSYKDSGFFARKEEYDSIHLATWPDDEASLLDEKEAAGVELMLRAISEVRKYKTSKQLTMGSPLPPIVLQGKPEFKELLRPFWDDLIFVTRTEKISFRNDNKQGESSQSDKPVIVI